MRRCIPCHEGSALPDGFWDLNRLEANYNTRDELTGYFRITLPITATPQP